MGTSMEILFMVFMVVVSVIALFAVMVVLRDIVKEILDARKKEKNCKCNEEPAKVEEAPAPAPAPVVVPAPVKPTPIVEEKPAEEPTPAEEPAKAEEPVAEEPAAEEDGKVSFAAGQQQTIDEKYLELSNEAKGWYDEIIKHAAIVEGSKRFKNARYEEYKLGNSRLVRMLIKRGVVHCEFILHNSDFKNYVNENKISVRQAATTMRIDSKSSVDAAKNSIDIVVAAIAEEREYKKQLAREKRKAARELAAAGKESAE